MAKREFNLSPPDGLKNINIDFNPVGVFVANPTLYPLYLSYSAIESNEDNNDYVILPGQSDNLPVNSRNYTANFYQVSSMFASPRALLIFYDSAERIAYSSNANLPLTPYQVQGIEVDDTRASGSGFNTHDMIDNDNHTISILKSMYFRGDRLSSLVEFQLWVDGYHIYTFNCVDRRTHSETPDIVLKPGSTLQCFVFNVSGALLTYKIVFGWEEHLI